MRHDPEGEAARFLGGAMSVQDREAFSSHLLICPQCWAEVAQGRTGRSLAESTRTVAPMALRERVRALVDAEAVGGELSAGGDQASPATRRRWLLPVGVPAAAAAVIALILVLGGGTTEPPSLRQAVADYSAQQLPGAQLPRGSAPDLSGLGLEPVGAGGGSYAGLEVDGYAYRDPAGRRVVLYLSDEPFPEAPGARLLADEDGPWLARRGDVFLLCARMPHALLVVGQDSELVLSAASALGVL